MNTKSFNNNFMEKIMEDEAWKKLSSDFPWTEKMLEKFQNKVDWEEVSNNYNMLWTPSMLDKFKWKIGKKSQIIIICFGLLPCWISLNGK